MSAFDDAVKKAKKEKAKKKNLRKPFVRPSDKPKKKKDVNIRGTSIKQKAY
jgi:hypothetical protein